MPTGSSVSLAPPAVAIPPGHTTAGSEQLAPAEDRRVAENPARLADVQKGVVSAEVVGHRHVREHLAHQLAAGALHHRIGRGDDEVVSPLDVDLQREPDTLGHVTLIDVAPEGPLPAVRVVPAAREVLVVGTDHDV